MVNNVEEQRVTVVLLIVMAGGAFACGTLLLGYLLADDTNAVLLEDRWLNLQLAATLPTLLVSLVACRYRLRLTKKQLARTHLVLLALLALYFTVQYGLLRREQGQVLATFQAFRRAYSAGDEQRAYALMTPAWQQAHNVDDVFRETAAFWALGQAHSIYTVRIRGYSGWANVVPNAATSWWFRPAAGASWGFEKVDGVWYVAPANINFYMALIQFP